MANRSTRCLALCSALEPRRLFSVFAHATANDISYDNAGNLHLAFYDSVEHELKYAVRSAAGNWSSPQTIESLPSVGRKLSLAIDPSGNPGVAYLDAQSVDLKFAHLGMGGWSVNTVESRGRVGHYPSLAYKPNGQAVISHFDATHADLRVIIGSDNGWRASRVDGGGDVGRHSSLAINPENGRWLVAYERRGDNRLMVARELRDGVRRKRIEQTVAGAAFLSLAFDSQANPAFSYFDAGNANLRLARFDGVAWQTELVSSSGAVGMHSTLLLDPHDTASIVHYDTTHAVTKLAWMDNGVWTDEILATGSAIALSADVFNDSPVALSIESSTGGDINVGVVPQSPTALGATTQSHGAIDLEWSSDGVTGDEIIVQRRSGSAGWSELIALPPGTTTFHDSSLDEASAYEYRVVAVNDLGRSMPSALAGATTQLAPPTALSITSSTSTSLVLSWVNQSLAASAVVIERSTDGVNFAALVTLPPGQLSYADSALREASSYQYRMHAANAAGNASSHAIAAATTLPEAPSSLLASPISDSQITLSWADHSGGETGFVIERSTDGVTFVEIATVAPDVVTFLDNSLAEATEHQYRVRCIGVGGASADSNVATATTAPAAPTSLLAAAVSASQIDLTWIDNSGGESGYAIERSDDGAAWAVLATLNADETSSSDLAAPSGAPSHYRIRALSLAGTSTYSNSASATTVPAAPASLSASGVSSDEIDLTWAGVNGALEYWIDRSTDGINFVNISNVSGGVNSYTDEGLPEGTAYSYRVRALGAAGYSNHSSSALASTLGSSNGAIHAHFSGGAGTGSSDQYTGVAGSGWSNAWQRANSNSTVTPTLVTPASGSFNPVNAHGNYLDVNTTHASGGTSSPVVGRQYTSFGGVTLAATHVVRFDLRIDTLGTFNSTNDRIGVQDTTTLTTAGNASSTWEIRAYGAAVGTAVAGKWSFYNGIRNNEASSNSSRWVASTMNIVAGTTYSFVVTTYPTTRSWDVSISASDGQATVTHAGLGYRTSAFTARGYVSFTVRTNAVGETRDYSLDSLTIDLV